jgi:hypothetical protein
MEGDSLKYDCAFAAGMLIYQGFVPEPDQPDALILGQLVFIILEAINEHERRQGGIVVPPKRLHADGGCNLQEEAAEELRFFCPRCFRKFTVCAVDKDRICLCPGCGKAMRTPDATGRN